MKTLGSRSNVRQVVFYESAKGKTETKSGGNAEKHASYSDLVQLITKLDQRFTLYESGSAKSASPNRGQCFQCPQLKDAPSNRRGQSPVHTDLNE